jgi:hypothetical protein
VGGALLGCLVAAPTRSIAQLGCCELVSPLGRACANTLAFECQPPSEFFPFLTCDGDTGQCFEDNNPLRALDRKSTDPGFPLFAGQVVLSVAPGTTVYRRIGACNDTGGALNYHTVYTNEGPEPEFANVNFLLPNGSCTGTQTLETVAETSVKKISKWCASPNPLTMEQCPPPRPADGAVGGIGGGAATVFSNTAVSILVVNRAGAPTLGMGALGALALLLAALGMRHVRRR